MEFSFLGFGLSIGLTFLLLIAAIIFLIIAIVYLKTSAGGSVTTTMANNNTKAMYFFIGALMALGLFVVLNMFISLSVYMTSNVDIPLITSDAVINQARFGWFTYLLLSLNVILMIAAIVLTFLGYSYVDPSQNNVNGDLVRTLALVSGIVISILLLPLIYMFYIVVIYNNLLSKAVTEVIDPFQNAVVTSGDMTRNERNKLIKQYNDECEFIF